MNNMSLLDRTSIYLNLFQGTITDLLLMVFGSTAAIDMDLLICWDGTALLYGQFAFV